MLLGCNYKLDKSKFDKKLTNVQKNINLETLLKAVGLKLTGIVARNFKQEGGVLYSGGWTPLAESTIKRRRKGKNKSLSDKILQDKGNLLKSFGFYSGKDGVIKGNKVSVGTQDIRAATHQYGLNGIPQRKMIPESEEGYAMLKPFVEALIKKAIKDASY